MCSPDGEHQPGQLQPALIDDMTAHGHRPAVAPAIAWPRALHAFGHDTAAVTQLDWPAAWLRTRNYRESPATITRAIHPGTDATLLPAPASAAAPPDDPVPGPPARGAHPARRLETTARAPLP